MNGLRARRAADIAMHHDNFVGGTGCENALTVQNIPERDLGLDCCGSVFAEWATRPIHLNICLGVGLGSVCTVGYTAQ